MYKFNSIFSRDPLRTPLLETRRAKILVNLAQSMDGSRARPRVDGGLCSDAADNASFIPPRYRYRAEHVCSKDSRQSASDLGNIQDHLVSEYHGIMQTDYTRHPYTHNI